MSMTFKNVDSALKYRAVVGYFHWDLVTPKLEEVEYADEKSTYQTLDEGNWILGIHDGQLRFRPCVRPGHDGQTKIMTWADPTVLTILKAYPWLRGWLLGTAGHLPVPKAEWRVSQVQQASVKQTCCTWGLPSGVREELVKRWETFCLTRNDKQVDLRRENIPEGVLLYGLTCKGGKAERIRTVDGINVVHGYAYLIEVFPRTGAVRVNTNQKVGNMTTEDWEVLRKVEKARSPMAILPDATWVGELLQSLRQQAW
jgi:hypothetical protein